MDSVPPFAALRAFDAAARHLSFKAAARDLGLTPTAISHQVRQLEALSGCRLFKRDSRPVRLTVEGAAFHAELAPTMAALAETYRRLAQQGERHSVTLGAGPLFASRWLVPRLADFWERHPNIDLRLHHSPLPIWQRREAIDLAVAWGRGDWPEVSAEPFLRVEISPVLAPDLLPPSGDRLCPEDLLGLALLHHRSEEGWRQWFSAVGLEPQSLSGTQFEDANVLLQAALAGRGVALGIITLIGVELSSGRLLSPFEMCVVPSEAYYLIRRTQALSDEVESVHGWLKQAVLQDPSSSAT